MRRALFMLPLVVFAVFAGVTAWYMDEIQSDSQRAPNIVGGGAQNKPVPEFDLPPLLDTIPGMATADFGGKVVLVNVFASWCLPCRAEHPLITRIAEEIAPVWGLNWKNERDDATAWLAELGNPYSRIGFDLSGRAGIEWGVYGVPETYIIDRTSCIRYKHVGPLLRKNLKTIKTIVEDLKNTPQAGECRSGS